MLDFTVIFWKENMESNALNGNPAVTNSRFRLGKTACIFRSIRPIHHSIVLLVQYVKQAREDDKSLQKKCPGYCTEYALLYPEHLHMIGRYNSLFGIDMRILKEEEILKNYIQNGVDRVVIRAW